MPWNCCSCAPAAPPPLTQDAFYVNAVTGSDLNPGTIAAPLKTLAKLAQLLEGRYLPQDTAINLTGVFPDPLVIQATMALGKTLTVLGEAPTQDYVGSITAAFVPYAPATNVDAKLTDAARVWAALIGKRIRMTSGAALGAITWLMKDLGANVARVGQFVDRTTGNAKLPANGDTFVVETLATSIAGLDVSISGGGFFVLKDVIVQPSNALQTNRVWAIGNNPAVLTPAVAVLNGCQFVGSPSNAVDFYNSFVCFVGCSNTATAQMRLYDSQVYLWGQVAFAGVSAQVATRVAVLATCVGQTAGFFAAYDQSVFAAVCDSAFAAASLGVFDKAGASCVETDTGGIFAFAFANAILFGSGNTAGNRFLARSGCVSTYITKPVITGGAGNDSSVGGTVRTWAQIPYLNGYDGVTVGTGNGAGIVAHA